MLKIITVSILLSFGLNQAIAQVQQSPGGAAGSAGAQSKDDSKAQTVNQLTGVVNMGMGGMNVMQGKAANASSTCGCAGIPQIVMGVAQIGLGVLNFDQSSTTAGYGDIANTSHDGFKYNTAPTGSLSSTMDDALEAQNDAIAEANKKLNPLGIKIDKNGTITTKDGKSFSKDAFKSAAAFAAAGGTEAAYNAALAKSKEAEKKILDKLGGLEEVEGGGAGIAGTSETIIEEEIGGGFGAGGAGGKGKDDRSPTSVAGLAKDFNGDKIGVAADNIFDMIKRRYELKDKQNTFINDGVIVALPPVKK